MTEFDEAVAWFRMNPEQRIGWLSEGKGGERHHRHAAVIVRRVVAKHAAASDEPRKDTGAVLRKLREVLLRNAGGHSPVDAIVDLLDSLAARSVSPDAAPATTSTVTHVEWLTVGTDGAGDEGVETFETESVAQAAARWWRDGGMTNVYVERHEVATTRTVSPWVPVDEQDGAQT